VADVVPLERRAQGIGYYGFVTAAALALGPALGLMVMNSADIQKAFNTSAVIAGIGLVTSFFISYEKGQTYKRVLPDKENRDQAVRKINLGYEKTSLPASLVMLLIAFAYSGIVTFLPTYAHTLGISEISIFFITYAVVLLVTRVVVDRITKRREISIVLLPGILLMAVTFILLSTCKTLPCFLAAAVCFAVGYGSVQPTLNAIVISLCEPHKRGAANSTFFSAMDLGIGLGALIWGFVSKAFGYPAIYLGCILFMAFAAVAVVLLFNRKGADE
jgi:predicted MFS family arabinose efflux permease